MSLRKVFALNSYFSSVDEDKYDYCDEDHLFLHDSGSLQPENSAISDSEVLFAVSALRAKAACGAYSCSHVGKEVDRRSLQ